MIAKKVNCTIMDFNSVSAQIMSQFDTVVFGGRFHAGRVDGLQKAKKMFVRSGAGRLIVFATGATPNAAVAMVEEAWKNNFTPAELKSIPHFYMQSGLRYECMSFGDKLMMKAFAWMMRKKKDKNEYEKSFEKAISSSYDISPEEYIIPLLSCLDTK